MTDVKSSMEFVNEKVSSLETGKSAMTTRIVHLQRQIKEAEEQLEASQKVRSLNLITSDFSSC